MYSHRSSVFNNLTLAIIAAKLKFYDPRKTIPVAARSVAVLPIR
jgi:hypothetical protein